jgi:hypothetical protein
MPNELESKSEAECVEILLRIFADNQKLLNSIAPDGWKNSPFIHFFHPSPQQQLTQYETINKNLASLSKKRGKEIDMEHKRLADFRMDNLENVNERGEFIQIIGNAVWDIFSDNHEVVAEDGKIYDFGSFRGSGYTIADFINEHYPQPEGSLDYLDFYMGASLLRDRADILPFYRHIFRVLKADNCDWHYSFPKLGLVSFKKEEPDITDPAEYNPLRAVHEELFNEKGEVDKLQEKLDRIYEQEYEEAKYKPLPLTVQAYKEVYGILPDGHPQKEFE